MNKRCFVIMGFGKKMDYLNNKLVNLDLIYEKVIKPLFHDDFKEYEIIRVDELSGSDIIDIEMYKLLMNADLVIADITTSNENAIYELGVRHAVKPFSTIIMKQKEDNGYLPFDLSHNRILFYKYFGEELDTYEIKTIKDKLRTSIIKSQENKTDSPFYTYLPNVNPPKITQSEVDEIADDFKVNEENMYCHKIIAEDYMKKGEFVNAKKEWEHLHEQVKHNAYFTQQLALATYKSKYPNEISALTEALCVIKELKPEKTLDFETIGITGAIYKRLYMQTRKIEFLELAIENYSRGYAINSNHYNGENYANCLILKDTCSELSKEEQVYIKYTCKKVYNDIKNLILQNDEITYWMKATLATCYFFLGEDDLFRKYRNAFYNELESEWQKETFDSNIKTLEEFLNKSGVEYDT